jgi:hypothetical protein
MVPIYSQQLREQLFTKLAYSALLATLICATVFFAKAVLHLPLHRFSIYDKLVPKDFFRGLFTTNRNKKLEAAVLASLLSQTNKSTSKCSIIEMQAIQRGTGLLYQQLEQALTRIEENVQRNCILVEQLAGSPPAIRTIKDLDAATATFASVKPSAEYEISEYATGNKCWRHSHFQHQVSVQDLLLHDILTRQQKNKLLGEKVKKIVLQNLLLAQKTSNIYDTPSEKLKKSPIMNILRKTVATYMFLKNMNNPRPGNEN